MLEVFFSVCTFILSMHVLELNPAHFFSLAHIVQSCFMFVVLTICVLICVVCVCESHKLNVCMSMGYIPRKF